ncbi:MAG: hypothetical protein ACLU37_09675 [Collinsella sp.]
MLKKFSVSNFKCFDKRITFDLSDPANYSFNQQVIQDGVKAKGIIYGANGSGKSNFALAIFDIVLHLTDKEKLLKNTRHTGALIQRAQSQSFNTILSSTISRSYTVTGKPIHRRLYTRACVLLAWRS